MDTADLRLGLMTIVKNDIVDAQDDLRSETLGVAIDLALKVGIQIAIELNAIATELQTASFTKEKESST